LPALVTVIEEVVAPVDQTGFDPVVEITVLPQLLVTVAVGTEGMVIGAAVTVEGELVHPPTV
jgi:hypothetical protein